MLHKKAHSQTPRLKFSEHPEVFEAICQRIEEGESLTAICAKAPMPKIGAFMHWVANKKDWNERYALAREVAEQRLCDEGRQIALGKPGYSTNDVQRDKLVIDRDRWFLAVSNPKKYSERKTVDMNITVETASLFERQEAARLQAMQSSVSMIDVTPSESEEPLW